MHHRVSALRESARAISIYVYLLSLSLAYSSAPEISIGGICAKESRSGLKALDP